MLTKSETDGQAGDEMAINPMHLSFPIHAAPQCGARTRAGTPCRAPAAYDEREGGDEPMSAIDEIEARAAAKAIYGTARMLEETFGVRAKGSTPKAKRRSVIRALERKFNKLRKRRGDA